MQKNLLFFAVMLLSVAAKAQKANMIFFAPNEEKFYLVVNGVQQNDKPLSNVKITNMSAPMQYNVRVRFEDTKLGVINDKVSLQPDTEKSWSIKGRKKKGSEETEYVIRTAGEVDKEDEPTTQQPEQVIVYRTEASPSNNGEGLSINMSMNDQGGNLNISMNGSSTSTSTSTVTTTTTTSHSNSGYNNGSNNGNYGCDYPMLSSNFNEAKKSIKDADFEDTKLSTAKSIAGSNCLTVDQIAEICKLFDFEKTKLDFAKYAYSKAYDKSNYFKVNKVFDFDDSKDELNNYIKNR